MLGEYTVPHERLELAIEFLTIPVDSVPRAVASAMAELTLAFREVPPPTEARPFLHDIERVMQGTGDGWEARAERLSRDELQRLTRAFLGLERLLARLHYETQRRYDTTTSVGNPLA